MTAPQGDDLRLKVAAGRALAGKDLPYLRTGLFAMKSEPSDLVEQYGVDREWRMYWNPEFMAAITVPQIASVWLHNLGHVLRSHGERFDALLAPYWRQPDFNTASDAAINADLRDSNCAPLDFFVYPGDIVGADRGMTAEQMFRLIPERPPMPQPDGGAGEQDDQGASQESSGGSQQSDDDADEGEGGAGQGDEQNDDQGGGQGQGQGQGQSDQQGQGQGQSDQQGQGQHTGPDCGSAAGGGRRPWEKPAGDTSDGAVNPGRANLIREQVARDITEHVKNRGTVPGGLERWANDTLDPKVDWRRELASVVRRTAATVAGRKDYSYTRPGRRSAAMRGVVMPAMRQPPPPTIRGVLDTSGSMSSDDLGQVLAEVGAIIKHVSSAGRGVEVLACDAAASVIQKVRSVDSVSLAGGGGTDMRVGITAAAKVTPLADLIITFTDGYTPWPDTPPAENPNARYIAVIINPGRSTEFGVPGWMHQILVNEDDSFEA